MDGNVEYLITRYEQNKKTMFAGDSKSLERMIKELSSVATTAEIINYIKAWELAEDEGLIEIISGMMKSRGLKGEQEDEIVDGEIFHEKFETVKRFVECEIPVFMSGEAGTGKSIICSQIAKQMNLTFYFANAITQEYKLTGYQDANGKYHRTPFREAFEFGGVFMLDEMDASIPEVLVILNEAIANGRFPFPDKIVYAHCDFRIIGAGNTFGFGASHVYVGRNQLDGASLDRFALVEVSYDKNIEYRLSNHDSELVGFVRDFRVAVYECGIQHIVSYRAISRMSKMKDKIPDKELIRTCLTKNLDEDDIERIKPILMNVHDGNLRGRYYECL